jgi:CheY-like chemotaxis protein
LRWLEAGEAFDLAIIDMHMPRWTASRWRRRSGSERRLCRSCCSARSDGARRRRRAAVQRLPREAGRQSQLFDTLVGLLAHDARPRRRRRASRRLDPEMAARHPLRILLAEDNVVNQKLALRSCSRWATAPISRATASKPSNRCERQTYDVVLMDVQMPEMDGLEAHAQICAAGADERPRIVAMTANAMQGDREMCLAAGMDDYLTKPIRVERLVEALTLARVREDR